MDNLYSVPRGTCYILVHSAMLAQSNFFFFQLILNDNSNTLLARYRRAKLGIVSRSRKAFLEVLPAGLSVIDLIVVTFVSFMRQRVTIEYHHHHN